MNYYLYKLKFTTPVHFGSDIAGIGLEKCSLTCHSDTLFSAICHETLLLYGEEELNNLVNVAEKGDMLISDLLPYAGDYLYLPKPVKPRASNTKSDREITEFDDRKNKKLMKKLKYILVDDWNFYIEFLNGDETFDPRPEEEYSTEIVTPKVSIPRNEKENKLYSVGSFVFQNEENNTGGKAKSQAGLYFVLYLSDDSLKDKLHNIIESLQYSGIGGKRSSGYGKFNIHLVQKLGTGEQNDNAETLLKLLQRADQTEYKMSLSVLAPKEDELHLLNDAYYTLIPRKGFVSSLNYTDDGDPVKKKSVSLINSGSCFKQKPEGRILDVSDNGKHKVYRYGKAMMVGV